MKKLLILSSFITILSAGFVNVETGWEYQQSTFQAFYMLETTEIDGATIEAADVIGAFKDGVCVGWVYADPTGFTTIPLMGDDGTFPGYMVNGDVAELFIYDATYGSILPITAGSELPAWENSGIFIINGAATADNIFGCTDSAACNYNSEAELDDGDTIAISMTGSFPGANLAVIAACSAMNINLLQSLGATKVINYQTEAFQDRLEDQDLVYDLLGDSVLEDAIGTCCKVLKNNTSSQYITLTHPLINTLDDKGLLLGAPHAFFLRQKIKSTYRPINVHWSIYRPSLSGLQELTHLSEENIIKPIIDSVYPLSDISEAHKKVATGHGSGKVVINNTF